MSKLFGGAATDVATDVTGNLIVDSLSNDYSENYDSGPDYSGPDYSGNYDSGPDYSGNDYSDDDYSSNNYSGADYSNDDYSGTDYPGTDYPGTDFSVDDYSSDYYPGSDYSARDENDYFLFKDLFKEAADMIGGIAKDAAKNVVKDMIVDNFSDDNSEGDSSGDDNSSDNNSGDDNSSDANSNDDYSGDDLSAWGGDDYRSRGRRRGSRGKGSLRGRARLLRFLGKIKKGGRKLAKGARKLCKVLNIDSGDDYSTDENDFPDNGNDYSAWGGDDYLGKGIVRGAKKICKVLDVTSGDDYLSDGSLGSDDNSYPDYGNDNDYIATNVAEDLTVDPLSNDNSRDEYSAWDGDDYRGGRRRMGSSRDISSGLAVNGMTSLIDSAVVSDDNDYTDYGNDYSVRDVDDYSFFSSLLKEARKILGGAAKDVATDVAKGLIEDSISDDDNSEWGGDDYGRRGVGSGDQGKEVNQYLGEVAKDVTANLLVKGIFSGIDSPTTGENSNEYSSNPSDSNDDSLGLGLKNVGKVIGEMVKNGAAEGVEAAASNLLHDNL